MIDKYSKVLIIIALFLFGCITTRDAVRLQGEIDTLKIKVSSLENKSSQAKGLTQEETQVLRKTLADLMVKIDDLQEKLNRLEGMVEESKHLSQDVSDKIDLLRSDYDLRLRELEERLSFLASASPPGQAKDVASVYQEAYDIYKKGGFELARAKFERLLKEFPRSQYVDNAHYWIGECLYSLGDYKGAIDRFAEVIEKYPKSEKLAPAYLKSALAFLKLGKDKEGRLFLQEVVKKFPSTEQARIARKKLKLIK